MQLYLLKSNYLSSSPGRDLAILRFSQASMFVFELRFVYQNRKTTYGMYSLVPVAKIFYNEDIHHKLFVESFWVKITSVLWLYFNLKSVFNHCKASVCCSEERKLAPPWHKLGNWMYDPEAKSPRITGREARLCTRDSRTCAGCPALCACWSRAVGTPVCLK